MKTIKFAAVAILMVMATSVFAQSGHNSFYVQYNSYGVGGFEYVWDDIDTESEKLKGIGVGCNKAFSVTSSLPLFIEIGAGLNYAWAKITDRDTESYCGYCGGNCGVASKTSSQHLMVNVPVNFMYKFQIPNSSITLEPYIGLNLKGHILGRMKSKYTCEACCDDAEEYFEDVFEDIDKVTNYFDKDDMGGKKYVATRLNIGWQIGANADFGKAFVGISYGSDFNKFLKSGKDEWKYSALNVSLGLRF